MLLFRNQNTFSTGTAAGHGWVVFIPDQQRRRYFSRFVFQNKSAATIVHYAHHSINPDATVKTSL